MTRAKFKYIVIFIDLISCVSIFITLIVIDRAKDTEFSLFNNKIILFIFLQIYDFIIIDCMPSLGMLTINALACADSVLIPVQAAYLPVKGLQQLIKTIGRVQRQLNPKLTIEGILLTMVDNRTNYAKDIALQVYDAYADSLTVFDCEIPMSVRAAETSAEGSSLYVYDPKGKAAFAYTALIKEVIKKEAM